MDAPDYPYAGLILPDHAAFDIRKCLAAAAGVLARLDGASGQPVRRSKKRPAVMADRFGIAVRPPRAEDTRPRATLRLISRDGAQPEGEQAAHILAQIVLSVLERCPADQIEWFSSDSVIEAEDFIRLHSYVSPRRKTLAPIERDEEQALADSIRAAMLQAEAEAANTARDTQEAATTIGKAAETVYGRAVDPEMDTPLPARSGGGMTGLVLAPVSALRWGIGLLRGMDFRLATRILSLTALVAVLHNSNFVGNFFKGLMR
ncbi:hypothetical protein M4578_20750 [Salipiger sp. P9]|uniref:hypothetical protein n=1 Tax=Salipiger pentaromativorans TaxID=2943193 RepID=UPI0021588270|nr:hypothetical protein [Salipiger pentaromativorans]MCR8550258.1 hypothetical protein [Salipiger pentaromativorans]